MEYIRRGWGIGLVIFIVESVENSVGSRRSGGEKSGGELLMELKKRVINEDGVCW